MNAQTKVEVKTLASAMADAFAEFEAAAKAAENAAFKQGGKVSKYADLGAVIDAVKPALIAHRLFFTQSTHDVDGGVCVETTVHHESGESLSFGRLFVPASKRDAHGYGSALTYARRYSLMTAFGIPAEDDDGNAATKSVANGNGETAEKVPGIHKIKERLRKLRDLGNDAPALDIFNNLVSGSADDLTKIKEANHSWWTGDGEDSEGLKAWILRRRAELSDDDGQFAMLIDSMKTCETIQSLTNWMAANEAIIGELDGAESRKFELAYNLHESTIIEVARANA